jgi:hypothetical protein
MFRKTADSLTAVKLLTYFAVYCKYLKLCDSDLASLWRHYFCTCSDVCKEAGIVQLVQGPATGWTAQNSNHFRDKRISVLQNRPHSILGPSSLLLNVQRNSFPGVMRPAPKVHHSPPYNAEVQNGWSYNSATPYALMAWTGTTSLSLPVVWIDTVPA